MGEVRANAGGDLYRNGYKEGSRCCREGRSKGPPDKLESREWSESRLFWKKFPYRRSVKRVGKDLKFERGHHNRRVSVSLLGSYIRVPQWENEKDKNNIWCKGEGARHYPPKKVTGQKTKCTLLGGNIRGPLCRLTENEISL